MNDLDGARVVLLEARMSTELAELVRRRGGVPVCVPAVREASLDRGAEVAAFVERLVRGEFALVVFQTGVGANALFRQAEQDGLLTPLLDGLRRVTTVCRGPKPTAALNRAGVPVSATVPEPFTTTELVATLRALNPSDKTVAVLHYGERNTELERALAAMGARLHTLSMYEWQLPEDTSPLALLVDELIAGDHDALAITSQVQIRHLVAVARTAGRDQALVRALNDRVIVAAVGPTAAAAARDLGISPKVEPEHPKMGHMVSALANYVTDRRKASA